MKQRTRWTFPAEFKLECAQAHPQPGLFVPVASEDMNVGTSALESWVKQRHQEREGRSVNPSPPTPEFLWI